MKVVRGFWKGLLALAAAAALAATFVAVQARSVRDGNRELLRLGLEDVARRVRATEENHARMESLSSAAALSKARAFARIVACEPGVLKDRGRLEEIRRELDVDELHVSDGKGVLVASIPRVYEGYDMSSHAQSVPFMEAVTNAAFELVQAPQPKGVDGKPFQYAGVARRDSPGIVQVGFCPARGEDARKLADVDAIISSTRIGRGGFVKVARPGERAGREALGVFVPSRVGGREYVCMSIACAGRRVTAGLPEAGGAFAGEGVFLLICCLDVLFAILLIAAFVPSAGGSLARHARALSAHVDGARGEDVSQASAARGRTGIRRFATSPVAFACGVSFVLALVVAWTVETRVSQRKARELLFTNAEDVRTEISASVDDMLFFIGNAICRHYRRPEAMTQEHVAEVMRRYDIDELNVVDARGVVVAGAIADIGYAMGSNPNSAKFNRLLEGVKTYAQPFRRAIENPSIVRKYAGVAFPDAKGYIQMGFDQKRMKRDIDYRFANSAVGRHVGETGYLLCADNETGEIVSSGAPQAKPGDTLAGIGFDVASAPYGSRDCFDAVLYGRRCLCVSEIIAFHRVVVALPYAEILGSRIVTIALTAGILLVVLAVFAFFTTRLSTLVARLRGFIDAERRRLEDDLATAKTIQASSLPVVFPDEPEYKIFARMNPAKEVGGDFYDFFRLPSGRVVFLVADVSGKGVPAAMFMMRAKAILRSCIHVFSDLAVAVAEVNTRLAENNDAEMFVTAWVGVLDPKTGHVDYVNAGHNPPLVKRASGAIEWVRGRRSLVLAAMPGVRYAVQTLDLAPGDSVLLYTDGVTEATNTALELYGAARLEAALARASDLFVTEMLADLDVFVAGAEQADDITMLALDFKETSHDEKDCS